MTENHGRFLPGGTAGGTGLGAGDPQGLCRSPEGRSDFGEAQGPQRDVSPNHNAGRARGNGAKRGIQQEPRDHREQSAGGEAGAVGGEHEPRIRHGGDGGADE